MNNNLILVYPPKISAGFTADLSLALLYLAGAARDSNICNDIRIFDFNAPLGKGKDINDLLSLIDSMPGKTIVAINCLYSALFPTVRKISKEIKSKFPEVKIVTGGMHPTLFAKEIISNCPEIDAVGIGESDSTFPNLLRYFYDVSDHNFNIEGYYFRDNEKLVITPRAPYINDLDSLPRPGYEFYNLNEYVNDTSGWWSPDGLKISPNYMPLLTSRSCPNRCNFCSMRIVMGDRCRIRSAKNVFEEIKYLYDVYGVNYFKVEDDNLTLHREHIISLCKMIIDSGIKIYLEARNGLSIKALDNEVIELMRRAGFIMIALAVESGSDYIRNKVIGKNISREQIINTFKACKSTGMNVNSFFIVGMPEDTEETLKETANMLREIDASRVVIAVAKPLPGTKLFEQCVKDNLFLSKFDINKLWTGEEEENKEEFYIKRLLSNYETRKFWIKPYNLSIKRLEEIDVELQMIAYEKSKAWVEHMSKNNMSGGV